MTMCISKARAACIGCKYLWRRPHNSVKFKGRVYCGTACAVLLYGRGICMLKTLVPWNLSVIDILAESLTIDGVTSVQVGGWGVLGTDLKIILP